MRVGHVWACIDLVCFAVGWFIHESLVDVICNLSFGLTWVPYCVLSRYLRSQAFSILGQTDGFSLRALWERGRDGVGMTGLRCMASVRACVLCNGGTPRRILSIV
jgi:hypothetical protein